MATFRITAGDTLPTLDCSLVYDGAAYDLTSKTPTIILSKDGVDVELTTSVAGLATEGVARHTWTVGETATIGRGRWPMRVVVTAGNDTLTFPDSDNPLWLEIG